MKTKILLIFLSVLLSSISLRAQDIIYKINGDKLNAKIIEIVDDIIKFKPSDNLNGPIRNIKTKEVFMIKYANGQEELFNHAQKNSNAAISHPKEDNNTKKEINNSGTENIEKITPAVSLEAGEKPDKFFLNKKNKYFAGFGVGYGQTYGGLGFKYQGRIGNIVGFGYHIGTGHVLDFSGNIPAENLIWVNIGAKLFWYKGWYVDFSYGSVANYTLTELTEGYFGIPISTTRYETAYGPSILIGIDLFFNKHYGLNVAAGTAINITESRINRYFATFDIGFIAKF